MFAQNRHTSARKACQNHHLCLTFLPYGNILTSALISKLCLQYCCYYIMFVHSHQKNVFPIKVILVYVSVRVLIRYRIRASIFIWFICSFGKSLYSSIQIIPQQLETELVLFLQIHKQNGDFITIMIINLRCVYQNYYSCNLEYKVLKGCVYIYYHQHTSKP